MFFAAADRAKNKVHGCLDCWPLRARASLPVRVCTFYGAMMMIDVGYVDVESRANGEREEGSRVRGKKWVELCS